TPPEQVSKMADRKPYPSDLTDAQWTVLEPLLPPAKPGGRERTVNLREVMNTLLYQARTGCQWAYLPHDLLPKSTVWDYFNAWKKDGTWQAIMDALRRRVRRQKGRQEDPSAAVLGTQTTETHHQGRTATWTGARRSRAASGTRS